MHADLWSFSLGLYARPGVEDICLTLQKNGANVCLLLCAAWLGWRGVGCSAQRAAHLRLAAQPWHDDVVRPLRELRQRWRQTAGQDAELAQLREQVKKLELQAEHRLLARLEQLTEDWPAGIADDLEAWLSQAVPEPATQGDTLQRLRIAVAGL